MVLMKMNELCAFADKIPHGWFYVLAGIVVCVLDATKLCATPDARATSKRASEHTVMKRAIAGRAPRIMGWKEMTLDEKI